MIGTFIGRLLGVFFASVLAVLTALVTLFWIGGSWATRRTQSGMDPQDPLYGASEIIGVVQFAMEAAPALTLAPAALAVIAGEVLKIRSPLYYIAGGGIAAVLMPLLVRSGDGAATALSTEYLAIVATAGFAAGLVYWLIAGRNA